MMVAALRRTGETRKDMFCDLGYDGILAFCNDLWDIDAALA